MKTGFTCAAGFNVVASATHGGSTVDRRGARLAFGQRADRGGGGPVRKAFGQWGGGLGPIENLPSPGVGAAPDMHREICSRHGRAAIAAGEEEELTTPIALPSGKRGAGRRLRIATAAPAAAVTPLALAAMAQPVISIRCPCSSARNRAGRAPSQRRIRLTRPNPAPVKRRPRPPHTPRSTRRRRPTRMTRRRLPRRSPCTSP